MLSRIAESLFWIGRYVERADDTARILQVHLRMRVEDPWVPESESCSNLLALMGIPAEEGSEEAIDQVQILRQLGWDRNQPTSIAASFAAARENARRAREVIPSSLWEVVNKTWQRLPQNPVTIGGSQGFLDWTREQSALFTGVARGSMVRDDGWQFMLLGRSLEQIDMTSRMVASAGVNAATTPWPAVLRGCGAYDAFLRTYRGFRADREAAEFLILDERFPRSIMHGLTAAFHCLRTIRGSENLSRSDEDALRMLGQLRARYLYADLDHVMDNLLDDMTGIQHACDRVTAAITQDFFAALEQPAWTTEGIL